MTVRSRSSSDSPCAEIERPVCPTLDFTTLISGEIPRLCRRIVIRGRGYGRCGHRAPAPDHGLANGRCRGPLGPNVLRAPASLRDSGRSADASSVRPQTEDAPNVPGSTCNGDPPASNILLSKRSPRSEAARALRRRSPAAGSRCTPKSALNSARLLRLRVMRQTSNSISSCASSSEIQI